jgi:hypothetical protein
MALSLNITTEELDLIAQALHERATTMRRQLGEIRAWDASNEMFAVALEHGRRIVLDEAADIDDLAERVRAAHPSAARPRGADESGAR